MISGFEVLIGSAFGDQLVGDAGANTIDGGAGGDFIGLSGGADKMDGGRRLGLRQRHHCELRPSTST